MLFSRKKNQSGQVIILTGLLLPMLIMGAGLTIDFGNLYLHKAKLQNTADAAVIAAGWNYVKAGSSKEFYAKEAAGKSVELNFPDSNYEIFFADEKYIRVVTSKRVPIHFLKLFVDDAKQGIEVSADAYVKVSGDGKEPGDNTGSSTENKWNKVIHHQYGFSTQPTVTVNGSTGSSQAHKQHTSQENVSSVSDFLGGDVYENYLNALSNYTVPNTTNGASIPKSYTYTYEIGTNVRDNSVYEYVTNFESVSTARIDDWEIFSNFNPNGKYFFDYIQPDRTNKSGEMFKKYTFD